MTMAEIMIASVIGLVVILGITTSDVGRVRQQEEMRMRSGLVTWEGQAARTSVLLARSINQADVIDVAGGRFSFRIPDPAGCPSATIAPCLDNPIYYRWDQYRLVGPLLQYNAGVAGGACGPTRTLADEITAFTVVFMDQAGAPPGGEPAVQDNNLVDYAITWTNAAGRTHTFRGRAVSRGVPYSDILTTGTSSGIGLSAAVPAGPPACL
jgi:hypothetical protein